MGYDPELDKPNEKGHKLQLQVLTKYKLAILEL